jgi:hypothetical protein
MPFKRDVLRLTILILAHVHQPVSAQSGSPIQAGENILVSGDAPGLPHVEPHLSANPTDPDNLVAATIVIDDTGAWTCAVLATFDGGKAWVRTTPMRRELFEDCGDPWVAFAPNGDAYFSAMIGQDSLGQHSERTFVFRSEDGGRSWSAPTVVPLGEGGASVDHPSIVVDNTGGPSSGTVYVIATQAYRPRAEQTDYHHHPIILSHSSDQGKSFSPPTRILPTNLVHQAGTPVVLSDGTVAFTFYDFAPWDHSRLLETRRIWTVTSTDGGRTISLPALVAEISSDPQFATLAVDPSSSSTFRDRLYSVWTRFEAAPRGISLAYSSDRGRTWSTPTGVDDDDRDETEQRIPVIAVNREGVVGVAWYDARRAASSTCFDVFFAASLDGGDTFLPNVRVSDTESCSDPNVPGNVMGSFDAARIWPAGGHYFGLAADLEGVFHVLWADSRAGVFQLWTTTLTVNAESARPAE